MMRFPKWKRNPVEALWAHVQEPKSTTITMAIAHFVAAAVGVVLIVQRQDASEIVQGLMLFAGGFTGAGAALFGFYQMERPSMLLTAAGIILWMICTPLDVSTLFAVLALLLGVTRWLRIRDLDVTPGEPVIAVKGITR